MTTETKARPTMCTPSDQVDDAITTCCNCGWTGKVSDLDPLDGDWYQNIEQGSTVPYGECPADDCGAWCYPDAPEKGTWPGIATELKAERDTLRAALVKAEEFMRGFEGDEMQEGIDEMLGEIREALGLAP